METGQRAQVLCLPLKFPVYLCLQEVAAPVLADLNPRFPYRASLEAGGPWGALALLGCSCLPAADGSSWWAESRQQAERALCQQGISIGLWHCQQQQQEPLLLAAVQGERGVRDLKIVPVAWTGLFTLLSCCSHAAEFYFSSLLCKPWMGLVLGVPTCSCLKIPWCCLFFAQDSLWVQPIEYAVKILRKRTGTVPVHASHLTWTVNGKNAEISIDFQ